jgi:hypothetical protein
MRPTMSRGSPNASLLRVGWVGDTNPGRESRVTRPLSLGNSDKAPEFLLPKGIVARWSHPPDFSGVRRSRVFIPGGRAWNSSFVPGLIEDADDLGEVVRGEPCVDRRGLNVGVAQVGLHRRKFPPGTPRPL